MALSKAQSELLDYCNIPQELHQFLGLELNETGEPKTMVAPDFLLILCNLLQIYETRLENLRYKFGRKININGLQPMLSNPPPEVDLLEEEIKMAWTRAASLWKVTDLVVGHPEMFNVKLNIDHVKFALEKKNLPVVEMLRYAKPEFFEIQPSSEVKTFFAAIVGTLGGALLGMAGGMMGGAKQVERLPKAWRSFAMLFYAMAGIFSGSAMGAIKGGSMGYQTGNTMVALQFGFDAACLNPFHEPVGSKYQRAVQLRREQLLFKLAHEYSQNKTQMPLEAS